MKRTIVKIQHWDSWIHFECFKVKFFGFRADEMEKKWDAIEENKRYQKYNSIYEANEIKIRILSSQSSIIDKYVKESKPFYRFWYNEDEKEMLAEAHELSKLAYKLEKENQEIKVKKILDGYECHRKIEELLQQNGFVLTQKFSEKSFLQMEFWTLEE